MAKRKNKFEAIVKQQKNGQTNYADIFPDKIPLDKIRNIWNDEHEQYNDKQLYQIREWVYAIASVIIHVAEKRLRDNCRIIELKPNANEERESNFICPGEYRRAS
jgi:hypothetical protein